MLNLLALGLLIGLGVYWQLGPAYHVLLLMGSASGTASGLAAFSRGYFFMGLRGDAVSVGCVFAALCSAVAIGWMYGFLWGVSSFVLFWPVMFRLGAKVSVAALCRTAVPDSGRYPMSVGREGKSTDARDQVLRLNELLSEFVAVHDDVFSGKLNRLIPVIKSFDRIDFGAHECRLSRINEELEQTASCLGRLLNEGSESYRLVDVVRRYGDALCDAVERLRAICARLKDKASGAPYSLKDYRSDLAAYNQATARYVAVGDEMNRVLRALPH